MKNEIYVDIQKTYGSKFTLVGISENFEFKNNKKTDNQLGWKFEIVLPLRGFEKLTVKIDDPNLDVSAIKAKLENPDRPYIDVTFTNLIGRVYTFNAKMGVSLKATGCKVVG